MQTETLYATPTRAAQAELLAALREVDTLHAQRAAGEDVSEASIDGAYDRIDDARAMLHSLSPELPSSPSLLDRMTKGA